MMPLPDSFAPAVQAALAAAAARAAAAIAADVPADVAVDAAGDAIHLTGRALSIRAQIDPRLRDFAPIARAAR